MLGRSSAIAARSARQNLQRNARFINSRFQSTASHAASTGGYHGLVGGLAGGAVAFITGYTWYHFSGAKALMNTSKQTQAYIEQAKQTVTEKTPKPNEAFDWLRDTIKSYAVFIPGARGYVDTAFDDLEKIRNNHEKEFDELVKNAYTELKEISSKEGLNMDSATKASRVLQKYVKELFDLAGDATESILNNHPQIKEKFGGSFDQLKEMGESYGPQAKEELAQTWEEISGILQRGTSQNSIEEIKDLIQEQKSKFEKLRDNAWQKGFEEAQQYLDKSPKLKQMVEDNADTLKKGNFKDLWGLLKESASSGKTEKVEEYITKKVDQAKTSSLGDLDKWLNMVPGGSNVIPQLQSLQAIAQKRGDEAESLLKETVEEIQNVLKKRKEEVEKVASEAKEDSK